MSFNYLRNIPNLTKRNLTLQSYSRLHQQAATAGSTNQQEFDRSIYFLSKLDKNEPVNNLHSRPNKLLNYKH